MTIHCVLLDLESTIIPVEFVHEVLFHYARRRLAAFLREHREDLAVFTQAELCQDTVDGRKDCARPTPAFTNSSSAGSMKTANTWDMGLKALQGIIWEEGCRSCAFTPNSTRMLLPRSFGGGTTEFAWPPILPVPSKPKRPMAISRRCSRISSTPASAPKPTPSHTNASPAD